MALATKPIVFYPTPDQLERYQAIVKSTGLPGACLMREALDTLLARYETRRAK